MLNTFRLTTTKHLLNRTSYNKAIKSQFHIQPIYKNKISAATSGVSIPKHILELNPDLYDKKANLFLEDLTDQLESLSEDDPSFISSVDAAQGVVEFDLENVGTYVINKQPPNKQIWLSSPISGPFRFDYDSIKDNWVSLRDDNLDLLGHLNKEIKETSNDKYNLDL